MPLYEEGSYKMTLIPDDAHVMLAAAVSTRNVTLITDTIMWYVSHATDGMCTMHITTVDFVW